MKRLVLFLLILALPVSFAGCGAMDITGIENYDPSMSTVGLTQDLFPREDFPETYQYTDSFFRYYDSLDLVWGYETAAACFVYDPAVYQEAKDHCFETFELCQNHLFRCEGYSFTEQLCYTQTYTSAVTCFFPEQFNMFGYNDETCTLVFLGYYNGNPKASDRALVETDFPQFLKTAFPDLWCNIPAS